MTKHKNSNCDNTHKLKLNQNRHLDKTQIVTKLDLRQNSNGGIQFGTGPGGWDSWDSWNGWDGWDSWDEQKQTVRRSIRINIYIFFFKYFVMYP